MSTPTITKTPIRFFGTTCEYGCFSNMYPAKITVNNIAFPTNEHFFQAKKFETTDPAYFTKVRTAANPKSAKALGKSRAHPIRKDWNTARLHVMEEGLRAKFTQHTALQKKLVSTGDVELQESAPRDNFWGTGSKGNGQNMLGKLLMKVRSEFRNNSKNSDGSTKKEKNGIGAGKKEDSGSVTVVKGNRQEGERKPRGNPTKKP